MRTDCRHYESRTYASGEAVRMCRLDLAPEAPWKCPENCPAFEITLLDAGWTTGSLVTPRTPDEPDVPGEEAAALLDQAEDIINEVGPGILAEVQAQRDKQAAGRRKWWPFGRRR
jgi:hypothetical protein